MDRKQHLLVTLAEECNEVAQRVSKALRFGLEEIEPGQSLNNVERIEQEFADLTAVYEMLYLSDPDETDKETKKAKVEKYLQYSNLLGTLNEEPLSYQNYE